jgi:hypothetical protein
VIDFDGAQGRIEITAIYQKHTDRGSLGFIPIYNRAFEISDPPRGNGSDRRAAEFTDAPLEFSAFFGK